MKSESLLSRIAFISLFASLRLIERMRPDLLEPEPFLAEVPVPLNKCKTSFDFDGIWLVIYSCFSQVAVCWEGRASSQSMRLEDVSFVSRDSASTLGAKHDFLIPKHVHCAKKCIDKSL
jgi:hypothetical protein